MRNKKEVIEAIANHLKNDGYWEELVLPGYTVDEAEQYGGEDKGSTYYVVYKVTDSDGASCLIKADGYYSSWDGTTWESDCAYEVEAYEKTVTDYRKI